MVVIPWTVILVARDILVALVAVGALWFLSVVLRFGETLEERDEWKLINVMLFVALVILLFRWNVLVVS